MALVRFFRDKEELYTTDCTVGGVRYPWNYAKYNNAVFFAKDTCSIWMNGSRYRISPELESKLSRGRILQNISGNIGSGVISFQFIDSDPITIELTEVIGTASYDAPGLMSPEQVLQLKAHEETIKILSEKVDNFESTVSGVMHFIGAFEKLPIYIKSSSGEGWSFDGVSILDELDFKAGDVILVEEKEYVCNRENVFIEFGDASGFATIDGLKQLEAQVIENKELLDEVAEQVHINTEDIATNKESIATNTASIEEHEYRIDSLEECLTWANRI